MVAYLASLLGASIGTWHTERLGRRKVLIFGSFACAVALACAMTCSASSHGNPDGSDAGLDHVASRGAIAFLIVFASVYSWGYQPLLGLYPSEVLSMKQRSTGLGCMVLASKMASEFALTFDWRDPDALGGSQLSSISWPSRSVRRFSVNDIFQLMVADSQLYKR